ncbi:MAG TPA: hypothetical protein VM802_14810 [Chitinophaga sp.]|uniref:hypothetical protein n=1 Tax=Chitinophaga sp. TaxID=1869181 RepID=UPI002CE018BC|nr:hypothetical protein [Chitinophaga sp.]HVI46143.1 hypothetical protein [Chitinophaga sp.]
MKTKQNLPRIADAKFQTLTSLQKASIAGGVDMKIGDATSMGEAGMDKVIFIDEKGRWWAEEVPGNWC